MSRASSSLGLVLLAVAAVAACGPAGPASSPTAAGSATPAATPSSSATSAAPSSGAPSGSPSSGTGSGDVCTLATTLKADIDQLATLDPRSASQADLTAAAHDVGQDAIDLVSAGASTEHLQALRIGATLAATTVTSGDESARVTAFASLGNTGRLVLQELGCSG